MEHKTSGNSRGKQIAGLICGNWMQMLLTFCTPVFLVRFLSRSDYGLYSQFYSVAMFLSGIFICAFPSGIYYFYTKIRPEERRAMLGNVYGAILLGAVLCSLVISFTPLGVRLLGNGGLCEYIYLIAVFVIFYMPASIITPYYVVRKDMLTGLFYPGGIQLLKTIGIVLGSFLGGTLFYTLIGVLIAQMMISGFVLFYCIYHTREFQGAPWFSWTLVKEQVRYTAPFAISGILGIVTRYFDKLICISFMSSEEYALYAIAFFGIPGILQIYSSITEVYLVEMSKAFHEDRKSDALKLLKTLEYKAVSCSLPVIAAVMIFAPEIISLFFTPKYIGSAGYFRLYIFYFTFEVIASGLIARASGNTKLNLITGLASASISLPFTYFAVKYYGAWGGISGVLVGTLLQRLFYVYFEMRIVGATLRNYFPWKEFGKIFSVTIFFALPLIFLQYYCRFNVWIGGVFSGIYLMISYYCLIRWDVFIVDRNYVKNLLARFGLSKLSGIF